MGQTNGLLVSGNEFLSNVVAIAGGQSQGLALKQDGTVVTLGLGLHGGNELPAGLSNVSSLAVQGSSCWAIRTDGTVARWGNDPDPANVVASLSNVTAISWAGYRSYLALKEDGTLLGMRFDEPGPALPVKVQEQVLSNVLAVASMGAAPLVLKRDGTVFRLERRLMEMQPALRPPYQYSGAEAVRVGGEVLNNVAALASGLQHCLALRSNGTVVAWGSDHYGESTVPDGLTNVVAIAAAEHLSLALKRDGTVAAWGGNYFGQSSVPAGLSNVSAVAAAGWFSLALTTGAIPSSVYIQPHGLLEEMAAAADLVFKARVLSSRPITNAAFQLSAMSPHESTLEVISTLKGRAPTNIIAFQHYTTGPGLWSGPSPPPHYRLEQDLSYLIFAARTDKPDYFFSPAPGQSRRADEFRQLTKHGAGFHSDEGALRTLDARPLQQAGIKEAHRFELNLMIEDKNPTNQLYGLQHLNAMSESCARSWGHSGDFKQAEVLRALRPLLTNASDAVAIAAIGCFAGTSACATQLLSHASALVQIATSGPTIPRRVAAIAALAGTNFELVGHSLPAWLQDVAEEVRAQAVLLLPGYPGEATNEALRERATDESPKVRAAVADAIGNGKIEQLLPTLVQLLVDPIGLKQPVPPLTLESLQEGGRANIAGDVHTSAGFALLKFDVDQVAGILKSNLNDAGFRPNYLCKLAERDAGPWFSDLIEVLEQRRARIVSKVAASGVEPKTNYFQALMHLSGTSSRCWNILYDHMKGLPFAAFAARKMDRCLNEMEAAGNTGSREPVMLYELYRMKGLNRRAAKYRKENEQRFAVYSISQFFDKVDARYPRNGMIPDQ